jgi:hypothetical protein
VVAAFVVAHKTFVPTTHRRHRVPIPSLVATSIALKIAAAATVLSLGGAAYAAHEGSLPDAAQDVAHDVFASMGVPASGHATDAAGSAGSSAQGPDATGPAAVGLCRAFTEGEKAEHGKALGSVAFQALARAAGGRDNIEVYCAGVLANAGTEPSRPPADLPTSAPTAPPTDTPANSNAPTDPGAPDGTPSNTSHPTGPTDPPNGRP